MQEVITLSVFVIFSVFYLKEGLTWNHAAGFAMIAGGAAMIGAAAMRNPVATGGTTAFAIVFSFVAANALWYQPGQHPSPFLRTRDAQGKVSLSGGADPRREGEALGD